MISIVIPTPLSRLRSAWSRTLVSVPAARLALVLAAFCIAGPAAAQDATATAEEAALPADAVDQVESEPPAAADQGPGASAEGADTDASADAAGEATPEEEYEWLKDEQDRLYRVDTLPKVEGTYSKLDDGWVRFPGGATFKMVEESEDTFWIRVYEKSQFERNRAPTPVVTPDDRAELEARFKFELKEVDRVRLVPFDAGLPKSGQWRDGFAVADMNGDGHLDIVSGPARKGSSQPVIFLGDGAGQWRPWQEARFERAPYDYGDVTVADWNGDGHLDLALGVHLRGLLALVGDGKGQFKLATEGIDFDVPGSKTPLAAFSSKAVAAADWDEDGRIDILAFGEGPKAATGKPKEFVQASSGFRVFLNQEDGSWRTVQVSPPGDRNFGGDFTFLDVDGDGVDELITATQVVGNPWIVLKRAAGLGTSAVKMEGLADRGLVDAVEAGDFDGDGHDDLALTYRAAVLRKWRSGIDVMLWRETGWERHGVLSMVQREPFQDLAVGDLDGDGNLDLAAVDDFGTLRLLLGLGDGRFEEDLTLESPKARLGCQGFDVELVDLDGDGRLDIVAEFAGEAEGMIAIAGARVSGCEGTGSLRAWKVLPVETAAQP